MNYVPSECFSVILTQAMQAYGVGCRKFDEILVESGITDISYKRISDYSNGIHTPSFERAKALLSALEYPIDDKTLMNALKLNREMIKDEADYVSVGSKEVRRTIRIKLKRLLPDKTEEETERFLWQRITDLCGDEKQLSLYVQGLIAKDLQEYILSGEEFTEDGNQSNSSN